MLYRKLIYIFVLVLLTACSASGKKETEKQEDQKAKELLQGIWLDEDTDVALFHVSGDSIYYTNPQSIPLHFKIVKDSLCTYGNEKSRYCIERLTEYSFYFRSISGSLVKLYKLEDDELNILSNVSLSHEIVPVYTEVTQKDSVVYYDNVRYRAYTYINPSTKKVIKTSYTEDGLSVDNLYNDNIIHICVYEGKKCLFASDIDKELLKEYVSEDFYEESILGDMNFVNVSKDGFLYQAVLCIPDSPIMNVVNLLVTFDGNLKID